MGEEIGFGGRYPPLLKQKRRASRGGDAAREGETLLRRFRSRRRGHRERQRQVFVLREWRGMTTQETALTLGCSENSVKQHHYRALRELRKLLAEVWDYA